MNEFEKACDEVEQDRNYELESENCIEWVNNSEIATVTFSHGRFINRVEKLAQKFPNEVIITHRNYNKAGNVSSIVAHIPVHYIKISNLKRDLSEEERKAIGERLNSAGTTVE